MQWAYSNLIKSLIRFISFDKDISKELLALDQTSDLNFSLADVWIYIESLLKRR